MTGAVLAGRSALRVIDLRGNKIGKGAIRILAEALERYVRVPTHYACSSTIQRRLKCIECRV